jgi:hypothetical protein
MAIILTRIEQNLFQDIFHSTKYFDLVRELLDQIVYYCKYHKDFTNIPTTCPNASLYPLNSTLIIPGENNLENFLLFNKRAISNLYY